MTIVPESGKCRQRSETGFGESRGQHHPSEAWRETLGLLKDGGKLRTDRPKLR